MMPYRFLILGLPLLIAACSSTPKDQRACPQVAVVRDLNQYADFGRAEQPVRSELVAAAHMDRVMGDCSFEDHVIQAKIDLDLRAFRGPRLGGDRIDVPYFLAVLDQDDKVIAKQNFSAAFSLNSGAVMTETTEKLAITIPNPANEDGVKWRVLAGFQLSPEQLAFNRGEFGEPVPAASPAGKVWRKKTK